MDLGVVATLAPTTLVLCIGVTLLSGVVKGAVGFAMPLIMVSGISSLIDPKLAIAAILFPVVLSNVLQTFRAGVGPAISAVREFWRYLLVVCLAIFATAQLVALIPSQIFYFVLGVPVVALSLMQLLGLRLQIPPRHRNRAEWIVGTISGVLGGLAGTWGPTTVLYLLAIDTPKSRQMVVQGVVYGTGSIMLLLAHLQSGILNKFTAPFSLLVLPAALLGLWLGFRIQDKLDQRMFRRATLVVLTLAGLNLLRKGFLG